MVRLQKPHDKRNQQETKELEFNAPKTQKNTKTTKNGAPGASTSLYNE